MVSTEDYVLLYASQPWRVSSRKSTIPMAVSSLVIIGNALFLGMRHGVDWDHIAAIVDIVGSSTSAQTGAASSDKHKALGLSFCYAIGHAAIVVILGLAAFMFASVLPSWIDPLMERAVGLTLLLMGLWIFYSLMRQKDAGQEFVLQSRYIYIFTKVQQALLRLSKRSEHKNNQSCEPIKLSQYSKPAAFGVGAIHGFGAETGTQVLMIAAVGGTANHFMGSAILACFVVGLLLSNTVIALLAATGFSTSLRFKPVFVATSVLTGTFSLLIGTLFVSGHVGLLPDWQN